MDNFHERFGIPETNLLAAEISASKNQNLKLHYLVPTRQQVALLEPEALQKMLTGWMCNCPIEIIPSRAQINEVKQILLMRPDASELSCLITMCNYYLFFD